LRSLLLRSEKKEGDDPYCLAIGNVVLHACSLVTLVAFILIHLAPLGLPPRCDLVHLGSSRVHLSCLLALGFGPDRFVVHPLIHFELSLGFTGQRLVHLLDIVLAAELFAMLCC